MSKTEAGDLEAVARKGQTFFVTRHAGAVEWARRRGIEAQQVEHLDVDALGRGDTVIGTLPLHLAAAVSQRGALYLHLSIDLPASLRGLEIDADTMDAHGARLEAFEIRRLDSADAFPGRDRLS